MVLHPYYKLDYIKLSWGGADEQVAEHLEGNPYAKNWQDEALKVVEKMVSVDTLIPCQVRHHLTPNNG